MTTRYAGGADLGHFASSTGLKTQIKKADRLSVGLIFYWWR